MFYAHKDAAGRVVMSGATNADVAHIPPFNGWPAQPTPELLLVHDFTEPPGWADVRAQRDHKLAQTDWVLLRAMEQGEPAAPQWLAYRQALRDVTQQADPCSIVWPAQPG